MIAVSLAVDNGPRSQVLFAAAKIHGRQRQHDRLHWPDHAEKRGDNASSGVEGAAGVQDGRRGGDVGLVQPESNPIHEAA